MYGICNLSIVPCRADPSSKSEMVSQLLFGDTFSILAEKEEWIRIKQSFDGYESWINAKQYSSIQESTYLEITQKPQSLCNELIGILHDKKNKNAFPIVMGSTLPYLKDKTIRFENQHFEYEGTFIRSDQKTITDNIINTAFLFLNAPYLWGGRHALGIDCSGFVQLVYKVNGYQLPRDASQQALIGTSLSFVEEAQPGDLAFFDNEEGKIVHVGIVLNDQQIIHASGKVRIDKFDHYGIFHNDRKKYSHMLRVIKRLE